MPSNPSPRSLVFSAQQVRDTLKGEPVVVRKPVKPQPVGIRTAWDNSLEAGDYFIDAATRNLYRAVESRGRNKASAGELTPQRIAPFMPGDVRFVKETFRIHTGRDARIEYCAGGVKEARGRRMREALVLLETMNRWDAEAEMRGEKKHPRRRPSGHLPKWASRLSVTVSAVSVEQDPATGQWEWVVTYAPVGAVAGASPSTGSGRTQPEGGPLIRKEPRSDRQKLHPANGTGVGGEPAGRQRARPHRVRRGSREPLHLHRERSAATAHEPRNLHLA